MKTRAIVTIMLGCALAGCLAASPAAAQSTSIRVGGGFGPTGQHDPAASFGVGGQAGIFATGGAPSRNTLFDGQAELSAGSYGRSAESVFMRVALLLRFKAGRDDDFERDPSPRFHLFAGPQLEVHGVRASSWNTGPDFRLAIGMDVTRRHSVVEVRYTARAGEVQRTEAPTASMCCAPARGPSPPRTTTRTTLVDGTLAMTVALRFGGS